MRLLQRFTKKQPRSTARAPLHPAHVVCTPRGWMAAFLLQFRSKTSEDFGQNTSLAQISMPRGRCKKLRLGGLRCRRAANILLSSYQRQVRGPKVIASPEVHQALTCIFPAARSPNSSSQKNSITARKVATKTTYRLDSSTHMTSPT